ncbi:MAG: cytochrome c family protein [Sphingomonadales bacterium]|nr:cytochrome c family protein [Sphingomonadales bacterium]
MKLRIFSALAIAAVCCSATMSLAAGAAGDPVKGKTIFARCMACHKIDTSNTSGLGPNLNRVVGRRAGTLPGFHYSPAMVASGRVWNEAALDVYLTAPARAVPGNRMAFVGLGNAADRQDVIAYIKSASR